MRMRRAPISRRRAHRKANPSARIAAPSIRRAHGQGSKHGLDGRTQSMSRNGKLGVAVRGWPLAPRLLFTTAFLSFCGAGHAAGLASGTASPAAWGDLASGGAACSVGAPVWSPTVETAEDLAWVSVWLGHFSGGRRFDDGN